MSLILCMSLCMSDMYYKMILIYLVIELAEVTHMTVSSKILIPLRLTSDFLYGSVFILSSPYLQGISYPHISKNPEKKLIDILFNLEFVVYGYGVIDFEFMVQIIYKVFYHLILI